MRFFKVIVYLLAGLALAGCFSTNIPFFSSDSPEEISPQPKLEAAESVAPVDEAVVPSDNELLADSLFEEVAEETPEKIIKIYIDPLAGIYPYHCRQAAFGLELPAPAIKQFSQILVGLYKLFVAYDVSLVEINPLILTGDDTIMALDAKINFDDSALFRHKDILEYRDINEEDPLEVEASKFNLNYINMDGNVGNMVNGAGLAMATMDIIKLAGAEPANFLDIGGGADAEMVENGFRIILSDKKVTCLLINIFGGILRCDILAQGIVQAAKNIDIKVPIVVRMEGTNVDEGKKILADSGLAMHPAASLKEAANKVAELAA